MVHSCITTTSARKEGGLYLGTSKSAEGYAALPESQGRGDGRRIHWQDADSSAKAVREIFPTAEIMLCGGHAGRAHGKTSESYH